ncbi:MULTISPECIES: YchJ family protein [Flavobacterium]|uniref:YchJ family metal-binding protein n=1 Tax=Flavobacterium algoritolerans TaxID=3041254 RepID=A0ABT6VEU9_9FLAO|nr:MULTISPECIES: YchJ family metal-binding protein [Flavobacterium]MDI5889176.1 YchJ family metal-binding protein [Flavobacterium yafengii]MDI5896330.1 YchJ family metal-binding protein [Flavobacterium algoritolerans]
MTKIKCYCGSQKNFDECCEPFINGTEKAPTTLELMRSRYSAYATHSADYLLATTHISERKYYSKSEILNWATSNQWLQLEIVAATENTVEFKAYFLDNKLQKQIHHEFSTFKLENGSWFYVDGKFFD